MQNAFLFYGTRVHLLQRGSGICNRCFLFREQIVRLGGLGYEQIHDGINGCIRERI